MKKTAMILTSAAAITLCTAPLTVHAADSVIIHMTIRTDFEDTYGYNSDLTVTDADGDGKLTVNDALILAHDEAYPGGSAAGLGDHFIWGTHGSFVYEIYDNETPYCNNLADVEAGTAPPDFCYTLPEENGYTLIYYPQALDEDHYYYEMETIGQPDGLPVPTGTELRIRTLQILKDVMEPIPVQNVTVRMNGTPLEGKTDANGILSVKLNTPGKYSDFDGIDEKGNVIFSASRYNPIEVVDEKAFSGMVRAQFFVSETAPAADYIETFRLYDTNGDGKQDEIDALNIMYRLHRNLDQGLVDCKPLKETGESDIQYLAEFRTITAKAETTTVTAVTTTNAATTTTQAATTNTAAATTKVATTAKAAAGNATTTTTAGNVKTGDTMPIAALAIAGLSAAAAAVFAARRKDAE